MSDEWKKRARNLDLNEPRAVQRAWPVVRTPDLRDEIPPPKSKRQQAKAESWDFGRDFEAVREIALRRARESERERVVEAQRKQRNRLGAGTEQRQFVEIMGRDGVLRQYMYSAAMQCWGEVETLDDPDCPRCGGWMSVRQNKQQGNGFWGCNSWPQCTGTLSLTRFKSLHGALPR